MCWLFPTFLREHDSCDVPSQDYTTSMRENPEASRLGSEDGWNHKSICSNSQTVFDVYIACPVPRVAAIYEGIVEQGPKPPNGSEPSVALKMWFVTETALHAHKSMICTSQVRHIADPDPLRISQVAHLRLRARLRSSPKNVSCLMRFLSAKLFTSEQNYARLNDRSVASCPSR